MIWTGPDTRKYCAMTSYACNSAEREVFMSIHPIVVLQYNNHNVLYAYKLFKYYFSAYVQSTNI